jgi:hypothetical protein
MPGFSGWVDFHGTHWRPHIPLENIVILGIVSASMLGFLVVCIWASLDSDAYQKRIAGKTPQA